jgi:MFS family permease
MYTSVRNVPGSGSSRQPKAGRIGANVFLLGLVSLFTDLSQEMVTAILPLYLTVQLGIGALGFGIIEGAYQGSTALVRLLGGVVADRRGRYKEVAAGGYGLSAVCKLGLLASAGAWAPTTAFLLVDRLGKGIRTAPRDALISLSADRRALGRAFGVHRAMDTAGALLGPLAAFIVLAQIPRGFNAIFVLSSCTAVVGLAILILFVRNPVASDPIVPVRSKTTFRDALALFRVRRYKAIVVAGAALGLMTVSDAFVYLVLQRNADLDLRWFPLLFLGSASAYLVLAVPLGRLADAIGRGRVFLGGYAALILLYGLLLHANLGFPLVAFCLALLGTYYAATDGVLMALAGSTIPESVRTSGFGIVTTATATTRFGSSLAFGALWAVFGPAAAVRVFLIGLVIVLPLAAIVLRRSQEAEA